MEREVEGKLEDRGERQKMEGERWEGRLKER